MPSKKRMNQLNEREFYAYLNQAFRDTADKDYIAARLCYRHKLVLQFFWSGLQAIEKYLKYILVVNKVSSKNYNHRIGDLYNKILSMNKLKFKNNKQVNKFVMHLCSVGDDRYFTKPYHNLNLTVCQLDEAVWHIRRYCQRLIYKGTNVQHNSYFRHLHSEITSSEYIKEPHKLRINGGYLEKLLDGSTENKAREALIWKNNFFGNKLRSKTENQSWVEFKTPNYFYDEIINGSIIDKIDDYITKPKNKCYRCSVKEKCCWKS